MHRKLMVSAVVAIPGQFSIMRGLLWKWRSATHYYIIYADRSLLLLLLHVVVLLSALDQLDHFESASSGVSGDDGMRGIPANFESYFRANCLETTKIKETETSGD